MNGNVGINLRVEYIDDVLRELPRLPHLEIIVDNWMSLGPHHKKLEKLRENYDILFHCVGMNIGGKDDIDLNYLKQVKELKTKFDPLHISDHLCFQANAGKYHHDLLPFPLTEQYINHVSERIRYIQDFLGEKILIENLSYYVEFKDSEMSEAQFLSKVSNEADCNLLLDLNNIWVNSKNIKVNVQDHLSCMDWDRVKEVHLAGAENYNGTIVDTHGADVDSEVLDILRHCPHQIESVPIIYERDNNIPQLSDMIEQVQIIEGVLNG